MTFPRRVIELFDVLSAPFLLFLSLFRFSLSLRYNDPLSTRVHQAFNVLHQFFSSFLFLPPLAKLLRRFADYSARRREREKKVKLAGCKQGEKRGDAARNKRICRRPFLFLLFTLLTLLVEWRQGRSHVSDAKVQPPPAVVHCHHVGGWNFLLMRDKLFLWPFLGQTLVSLLPLLLVYFIFFPVRSENRCTRKFPSEYLFTSRLFNWWLTGDVCAILLFSHFFFFIDSIVSKRIKVFCAKRIKD